MDWFSKIDPNALIAIATVLGTWIYHKVSGQKAASFDDTIRGIGKQVVDALVKAGDLDTDKMVLLGNNLMTDAMTKLGIPLNAVTNALVKATVMHAVGDALAELRQLDADADANMAKMQAIASSMPDVIAKAQADGLARVKDLAAQTVERVDEIPAPATPPPIPFLQPPTKAVTP